MLTTDISTTPAPPPTVQDLRPVSSVLNAATLLEATREVASRGSQLAIELTLDDVAVAMGEALTEDEIEAAAVQLFHFGGLVLAAIIHRCERCDRRIEDLESRVLAACRVCRWSHASRLARDGGR